MHLGVLWGLEEESTPGLSIFRYHGGKGRSMGDGPHLGVGKAHFLMRCLFATFRRLMLLLKIPCRNLQGIFDRKDASAFPLGLNRVDIKAIIRIMTPQQTRMASRSRINGVLSERKCLGKDGIMQHAFSHGQS